MVKVLPLDPLELFVKLEKMEVREVEDCLRPSDLGCLPCERLMCAGGFISGEVKRRQDHASYS